MCVAIVSVVFVMQKLNRAKTANSDHFTINKRSKYAMVLNDPETHSELQVAEPLSFSLLMLT